MKWLVLLAACGGGSSPTVSLAPLDAPPPPSFTYTAVIFVRPGITRATLNGADLPIGDSNEGPAFVVTETFPDYSTGLASPDVELKFFGGDELDMQGHAGPGACRHIATVCNLGTMTQEIVVPNWFQDFTRDSVATPIKCIGTGGECVVAD